MSLLFVFHYLCKTSLELIEMYVEYISLRIFANPGPDGHIVYLLRIIIVSIERFLYQANNLVELFLVSFWVCLFNMVKRLTLDLDGHIS
jgi:hypothetical protein